MYFNSLKTITSELLEPPSNINISYNTINNNSLDLSWTHSTSPNLPVYEYNINYNSLDSIKYPSYIEHNSNIIIQSSSIFNNANNFATIHNLNFGHTYNINIQARNILNDTFGS